ncbi:hypothetical protein EV649_2520 [Kribbella sp. VKM Ac-2569]|uniref:hypothetical protein n=1 Tax=Kribbella sp. VKM Ac-2569 TaxID=2512220 RepID=UPI00102C90AB|nr:hypothetical protein [Kribbella sp. VKM Ac-2569]RZT28736.1 hypothetical protein EV649_2520 [Kribbella sp. VKM Ac-2569]
MTGRKLLNVGLTLAVLVAIVALYRFTPTQQDIQQPTSVNGIVGRAVQTPRFDLTVDDVRVGKKLRIPRSTPDRDSLTTFVVVDASVTAKREPMHIFDIRIRSADGVTYLGANRSGLDRFDLTGIEFAPDIPARGSFVVEMPADKVPGATLLVMEKSILNDLEPQVTVPLGSDTPKLEDVVDLAAASDT